MLEGSVDARCPGSPDSYRSRTPRIAMCFSPEGDIPGGIVVTAIGIDALRHLHNRRDHLALAALPLVLGFHQIDEAFVWFGLQGHVPEGLGRVATWIYLVIAFVVLPLLVPIVVMLL